jgi:hypothetical protein
MRSTIMVSSAFLVTLFQVAPLHRTPRFFKRHEYGKRHGSLNQTGTSFAAASLKIGAKALRSPEDFIRNSSRKLASGKESPFILS